MAQPPASPTQELQIAKCRRSNCARNATARIACADGNNKCGIGEAQCDACSRSAPPSPATGGISAQRAGAAALRAAPLPRSKGGADSSAAARSSGKCVACACSEAAKAPTLAIIATTAGAAAAAAVPRRALVSKRAPRTAIAAVTAPPEAANARRAFAAAASAAPQVMAPRVAEATTAERCRERRAAPRSPCREAVSLTSSSAGRY
eukprot:623344-Pleurochrysis_carterae.AAC.5